MDDDKPPGYHDNEKTQRPLASDAKGSSSSSSSSSGSLTPLPSLASAPRSAMVPAVTRDNKTAYHMANNVSYINEEGGKSCSIVLRTVATQLQSVTTPHLPIEELQAKFVPHFLMLPSTAFLSDGGFRKDLRFAVVSIPNNKSRWLRVLVNPDAVMGMVADGPLRTILLLEHHTGESHSQSVGIQMPVEELRAVVAQALR
ncbi:hypothetical protein DFJ73DRAFT_793284 [Zopfochytrium polystomum]|nr:hypothetical protein DFJ73DRAFT_793284 [Zopfochytrium polystomum]